MNPRMERIAVFEGTRQLCRNDGKLMAAIAASIAGQKLYWEEDPTMPGEPRFSSPARMLLSGKKTVQAAAPYAREGKRVFILNFASSVCPGGGVLQGAQSQEESICRVSTLYFPLTDPGTAGAFYGRHWEMIRAGEMNRRNRDDIIYTPGVIAVREDAGQEKILPEGGRYAMDVITCAAPDLRETMDGTRYAPTEAELTAVFESRWRRILSVAAKQQAEVLILGAFGCGVFGNPPELVVEAFNHVAEPFRKHFETIEFAVYSSHKPSPNYQAFSHITDIHEPRDSFQ